MTEQNNSDQSKEQNIPFTVITQYVRDQSFEVVNPTETFLSSQEHQPNISVEVSTKAIKVNTNVFEVVLNIKVNANIDSKPLFIAELAYSGLVSLNEDQVPKDVVGPLLLVHTPLLLFPFARSIIATMTRDGGFPALMLHPVDFAALYQGQQENQEQELKEEQA